MRLILYLAHVQTQKLPKNLTLDELILEPGYEQWLYVAWQFGLEDDYMSIANQLVMTCTLNEEGKILAPNTSYPISEKIPLGESPIHSLHAARRTILATLLKTTRKTLDEMLNKPTCCLTNSPSWEQTVCTARSFYGLHRYLRKHEIYPMLMTTNPLDHASKIQFSVRRITQILTDPSIAEWIQDSHEMAPGHVRVAEELEYNCHDENCRVHVDLAGRIHDAIGNACWALSARDLEDIRRNADKLAHGKTFRKFIPLPTWK
ncbi:hypothetical protein GQ44DRAFT_756355 [Phaeosphaeriaceae sp. PMI808]|nr:hypothetical protein GQ44DRAFT_756355 [Phaeosphaeriaceae sp. PMI808]